ncbi:uncharacterized membrane protein YHL071W isoform X3 [Coffea arabica]|uniref:Uncharacterized membrane protein YHL071W isoform X3 n=1 Tax=Coffea arabica TaxID=13443 RepID=A0ABM4WDF6_COFAR
MCNFSWQVRDSILLGKYCPSLFLVQKHKDTWTLEHLNTCLLPHIGWHLELILGCRRSDIIYASLIEREEYDVSVPRFSPSAISLVKKFDSISFRRTKEAANKQNEMQQSTGTVEAIIVEVKDRNKIGGSFINSDAICCTPALAKDGSCKLGEVIIRQEPDNPGWPMRIQTSFEGNNEEATMVLKTVEINKTGMYYLYFMFCNPELRGTLISGKTVWHNPDGYLPGKMAPLMSFYGFMSLAYLVLGLFWFVRFVQCWKDVIQLHYHITAVIGLGMCEMALWYFEYSNFNAVGYRPMAITLWAVSFSAIKKTVSRLLLLVVSMGYGIMRPTLGGVTSKVFLLGIIYLMASEALELVEHLGNINDFSGKARLFLVLPVAVLDATFILWIFSSLSKTLEKLQIRRSIAKLELYRKFTNALAVSVLLSVAWIGYEVNARSAIRISRNLIFVTSET